MARWMMAAGLALAAVSAPLTACAPKAKPPAESAQSAAPSNAADVQPSTPAPIYAPAGAYLLDVNHSSLTFSVSHLGLSNYVVRFTRFDGSINLDPKNVANSSVTFTVDPSSVRTDYRGDYRATHPKSTFASWDEALGRDPNLLNARQFPEATFQSTSVEVTGPNTARVVGDLTMLGQTRPATFTVTWIGSTAKHPFTGTGAFGVQAVGTINRSDYGMTYLLGADGKPDLVGNAVTLTLNGEFLMDKKPAM